MKIDVSKDLFFDLFTSHDRVGPGKNFSFVGLSRLYDYITDLEEEAGEDIDLDVIGLCGEWSEADPQDLITDYGYLLERDPGEDEADYLQRLVKTLEGRTVVLPVGSPAETYLLGTF